MGNRYILFSSLLLLTIVVTISACSGKKKTGNPVDTGSHAVLTISGEDEDSFRMRTGFYLITKDKGVIMKQEKTGMVYVLDSIPFISTQDVTDVEFHKAGERSNEKDEICFIWDDEGREKLRNNTGLPDNPYIAVVLANRLFYVVPSKKSINTKETCINLNDLTEEEEQKLFEQVRNGR